MSPFAGCFHFRLLEGSKEREQQRPMCVESKCLQLQGRVRVEAGTAAVLGLGPTVTTVVGKGGRCDELSANGGPSKA